MSGSNRRRALQMMGWGMALPAWGLPVRLAASSRKVTFPTGTLTLRRSLERGLGENAAIVVHREWNCRFLPDDGGAVIDGRQVWVDVEAPAPLAALAKVEREREVTGLFPMSLGRDGRITAWSGREAGLEAALNEARDFMERHIPSPSEAEDAKRYLATMSQTAAAAVSQVPRDLFYPQTGERHMQRTIELPGGGQGSYEVTISASARQQDGLLENSERRIVTKLGNSHRTSRERWSIA